MMASADAAAAANGTKMYRVGNVKDKHSEFQVDLLPIVAYRLG